MKFVIRLVTITLLLTSTTLAVGNCTVGRCTNCEISTDPTPRKYCTQCDGAPISGTGINRSCTGGTEIPNCKTYNVQNGKPTCIGCKAGSSLFVDSPIENSICVPCNLATHYVNTTTGLCTAAGFVLDCIKY